MSISTADSSVNYCCDTTMSERLTVSRWSWGHCDPLKLIINDMFRARRSPLDHLSPRSSMHYSTFIRLRNSSMWGITFDDDDYDDVVTSLMRFNFSNIWILKSIITQILWHKPFESCHSCTSPSTPLFIIPFNECHHRHVRGVPRWSWEQWFTSSEFKVTFFDVSARLPHDDKAMVTH